jgi:hypothetical protein
VLKIIIGLPGCGKSKLLREMQSDGFCVFDDFHANAFADSPDVEMSQKFGPLMDELLAGRDCAVSDIAFCEPERRSAFFKAIKVRFPDQSMDWIYFENSPEKCRNNIQRRNREGIEHDLKALQEYGARYVIPPGTVTRPVCEAE